MAAALAAKTKKGPAVGPFFIEPAPITEPRP